MAHTDRDIRRVELRRHWDECIGSWNGCETCDRLEKGWRWWDWPEPSKWNRACRREERARERSLMQRAQAGHLDWDDIPLGGNASRHYRRPYYW